MSGVLDHLRAVRCQGYSTICCSATRRGIGCLFLNRAGEGRAGGGGGCVTSWKGLASCSRMERGSAGRIPENQVHLVQVHLGQVEESRRAVNKCSGLRASGPQAQRSKEELFASSRPLHHTSLSLSHFHSHSHSHSPHIFFHNSPFPPRAARIPTPSPRER